MKNGKIKKNDARYNPFVILKNYTANNIIRTYFYKKQMPQQRLLKDDEQ